MINFPDKVLTKIYCDEAIEYAVPNVLRDLVFSSDLRTTTVHTHIYAKNEFNRQNKSPQQSKHQDCAKRLALYRHSGTSVSLRGYHRNDTVVTNIACIVIT